MQKITKAVKGEGNYGIKITEKAYKTTVEIWATGQFSKVTEEIWVTAKRR
jgi:hypothetical protein